MTREENVENLWKKFMTKLIGLDKCWDEFAVKARELSGLEMLSLEAQEVLSRVSIWSEFGVAMNAIIAYSGSQGGFEVFVIPEKTKAKKGGKE